MPVNPTRTLCNTEMSGINETNMEVTTLLVDCLTSKTQKGK